MKYLFTQLCATLLLLAGIIGNAASAQAVDADDRLMVEAGVGLHASELVWSTGTREAPRSVLTYEELRTIGVAFAARYRLGGNERWQAISALHGRIGAIVSGSVQDSDFSLDNRHRYEFSRSVSEITGVAASRVAAAFGLQYKVTSSVLRETSLWMGFERNHQTLRMQHGKQIIPEDAPDDFLEGLDSRYHARWTGPWLGAELSISVGPGRLILSGARHFRTQYYGEGEWNLREDLMQPRSFFQEAQGSGYDIGGRYIHSWSKDLALIIEADHDRRITTSGHHTAFRVTGEAARTNLPEVVWSTRTVSVGLSTSF